MMEAEDTTTIQGERYMVGFLHREGRSNAHSWSDHIGAMIYYYGPTRQRVWVRTLCGRSGSMSRTTRIYAGLKALGEVLETHKHSDSDYDNRPCGFVHLSGTCRKIALKAVS